MTHRNMKSGQGQRRKRKRALRGNMGSRTGRSEFRSGMPILIAIGLKQRPETAEVEEFRSALRVLDGEEEQRVAKATAEVLKRFAKDQAVAAAKKRARL